ncbi:MAG: diguanylate cyclase [Phycisphaerales bacterium]|nr:diguanylate cyclase [Phycisphaerales bacterium]MCI0676348.1 diguanylate cyclase [Phycisphaerales bacterium]
MIHRLLKARLKSERLEIHCATSASQGVETARALLPEVILLDVDMPDMDGFSVLAELKADPHTHDIPVIIFSGSYDTKTKIRGLEMGAFDFVTKPFDVGELKARVRSAVRIRLLISMLAQRAQLDGLTGLWNRAHFDQRLREEVTISHRHGTKLALILCDLDRFKTINDTYGHPFGDQVLEEFAKILNHGRAGDVACRYGGEEFAVILPRADSREAASVAERFRQMLREHAWIEANDLVVTASFGVTDLETISEPTAKAMLESADQALYAAKTSGRDRVIEATQHTHSLKRTA